MQREIKFRVRGRGTKIVLGFETLMPDITNDGWQWAKSAMGRDWESGTYTNGYYIREQFTGLKDKNGKEIYEGDVVQWGDEGSPYVGHIHWNNAQACFAFHEKHESVSEGGIPFSTLYPAEVIGNIYENPELLK